MITQILLARTDTLTRRPGGPVPLCHPNTISLRECPKRPRLYGNGWHSQRRPHLRRMMTEFDQYICATPGDRQKKRDPWGNKGFFSDVLEAGLDTSWQSEHQRRGRKEEMVPLVGSQPSNGASRAYRKSFLKGPRQQRLRGESSGKCMAAGVVTGGCGRLSWDVGTLVGDKGTGKYLDSVDSRGLHLFKLRFFFGERFWQLQIKACWSRCSLM